MSSTTVTPAPAQASVTNDGPGLVRVMLSTPYWNVIDATLTREELTALHSAVMAYVLTEVTGGEFYTERVIADDTYRPGDSFPNVGYVRRFKSLLGMGVN